MASPQLVSLALVAGGLLAVTVGAPPAHADAAAPKCLSRIYLVVHALNWLEIVPGDPRRKTREWEQWPGRCEICYEYEQPLKATLVE